MAKLPLLPPEPPGKGTVDEVAGLPGVTYGHIEEAFQEIDYDGNGFIGVGELRYLLYTMGERPSDEELDEMIRMLDTEGLGQVSHEQFASMFGETHPVLLEMISRAPTAALELEGKRKKGKKKKKQKATAEMPENVRSLMVQAAAGFLSAVNGKKKKTNPPALPKARPTKDLQGRSQSPASPPSPASPASPASPLPVHMTRKQNPPKQ